MIEQLVRAGDSWSFIGTIWSAGSYDCLSEHSVGIHMLKENKKDKKYQKNFEESSPVL
jgi:hypothetical protein